MQANSSRTEILPTLNVEMLLQNKLWSSLMTSLKKAKTHMEGEPKGVDVCYGYKPQEISLKIVGTLVAPLTT